MAVEGSNDENEIVWLHSQEKKIIFYKEPYSTTIEQLDINFQTIDNLGKSLGKYHLLIDLTGASRPKAEIRQHIFEKFQLIKSGLLHVGIFTGKNLLLNMAATFIMRKVGLNSFSIHKSLKEAEEAIERFTE